MSQLLNNNVVNLELALLGSSEFRFTITPTTIHSYTEISLASVQCLLRP